MTRYISILRGINVGGKRKILMADLKPLYEVLGFSNVNSYIQSGNIIFDSNTKESQKELGQKIEQVINKAYGFDVPVIIRTVQEIEDAIAVNPYLKKQEVDIERLHLTYLADIPSLEKLAQLKDIDFSPDKFEIIGNDVFIYCSGKYSDSKLTNKFFESKLKITATTRNWKTVNKLIEIATIK
ncbi:MAG: DUF1697 domain-containing protein [Flavobacteriales bacterium]|nr:DUF1697 domain-containing protein [Flavobacteriales bacterium]